MYHGLLVWKCMRSKKGCHLLATHSHIAGLETNRVRICRPRSSEMYRVDPGLCSCYGHALPEATGSHQYKNKHAHYLLNLLLQQDGRTLPRCFRDLDYP